MQGSCVGRIPLCFKNLGQAIVSTPLKIIRTYFLMCPWPLAPQCHGLWDQTATSEGDHPCHHDVQSDSAHTDQIDPAANTTTLRKRLRKRTHSSSTHLRSPAGVNPSHTLTHRQTDTQWLLLQCTDCFVCVFRQRVFQSSRAKSDWSSAGEAQRTFHQSKELLCQQVNAHLNRMDCQNPSRLNWSCWAGSRSDIIWVSIVQISLSL